MNRVDLKDLKGHDPALATRVANFVAQASKSGAQDGAQRLALAAKQFKKLSVDEAYHIIDPEAFLMEMENRRDNTWLGFLNVIRNVLGLLPLIMTWYALFRASSSYQQDIKQHPGDLSQPFLLLWQQGFRNIDGFTFSNAALADVILLVIYAGSIFLIPALETTARLSHRKFTQDLQELVDQLMDAIGAVGVSRISADDDIDKLAKALERVVSKAVFASNQVTQEAKSMIKDFHDDLGIFQGDLKQLTIDTQTHNKQIQDLTAASTQLATSSSGLVSSANQLAQGSQGIDRQLVVLNSTQVQMVQTIGDTQQKVVQQIGSLAGNMNTSAGAVGQAAKDMNTAARQVETVGRQLTAINPADITTMTTQAINVANTLNQVDKNLKGTIQSIPQLVHAALSGHSPTQKHPWWRRLRP